MSSTEIEKQLGSYVENQRERLVEIIRDLVRIPSENSPPRGEEAACQFYISEFLRQHNCETEVYELDSVPGLREHPLFWPGREYANRPNVGAHRPGSGGGRSLLLSGHIDTVPCGTQPWTRDPFGGEVAGNRLYGRGSNDMKGGVGTHLFLVEALNRLGVQLKGDLLIESVVDEEFGGVNGTLAGRLRGFNADAAVISEPTALKICPAQRGGRFVHINLSASGGILAEGGFPRGILDQLRYFLNRVEDFADFRRKQARIHEYYLPYSNPVPVSITKVFTSPWGNSEPVTIPEVCRLEMYWQLMPGETQAVVDQEFSQWLDRIVAEAPEFFPSPPIVEYPIRWLPGSAILKSEPLVSELSACANQSLEKEVPIVGFEAPCDMYVFHQAFKIPAVLWGVRGGNTHAADEYLEIDSAVEAAKTLLLFVCRWCGIASVKENLLNEPSSIRQA